MCVYKNHAFICFGHPLSWSGTHTVVAARASSKDHLEGIIQKSFFSLRFERHIPVRFLSPVFFRQKSQWQNIYLILISLGHFEYSCEFIEICDSALWTTAHALCPELFKKTMWNMCDIFKFQSVFRLWAMLQKYFFCFLHLSPPNGQPTWKKNDRQPE